MNLSSEKPQLSNLTRDSRPQFHAVGGEDVRSAPRYVHLRAETSPAATNNLHSCCCCGQWSDVIMRQPESRAAAWRAAQLTRSCQLVLSNVSRPIITECHLESPEPRPQQTFSPVPAARHSCTQISLMYDIFQPLKVAGLRI